MKDVRGSGREEVMLRICSEFLEMPGLRLTCRQAQRLFGAGEHTCAVLDELVAQNFLKRHANGMYVRTADGAADVHSLIRSTRRGHLRHTA